MKDFKVDVVLLTKNSIKPCLGECVRSIYANVPVNRLVVVDGGSEDGTIEFMKRFPKVVVVEDLGGNRATARQKGINMVETEWFVFVDSDVILSDNWFNEAWKNVNDHVGAIQGFDNLIGDKSVSDFADAMAKLRKHLHKTPKEYPAFTGDVLIKTSIVKDIKIPNFLHYYEDQYTRKFIRNKGFKWVITQNPSCYHHSKMDQMIKDAFPSGFLQYKIGHVTALKSIMASFTIIPKVIYAFLLKRNPSMVKILVRFQLSHTSGVLKAWSSQKR